MGCGAAAEPRSRGVAAKHRSLSSSRPGFESRREHYYYLGVNIFIPLEVVRLAHAEVEVSTCTSHGYLRVQVT